MSDLLNRVGRVLLALNMLSEGRTASIDKDRVSGGGGGDGIPRIDSTARHHTRLLERWCKGAEDAIDADQRRQQQGINESQRRFWAVNEYEGLDYRTAAEKAGVADQTMWKWRLEEDREPRKGLPKAA